MNFNTTFAFLFVGVVAANKISEQLRLVRTLIEIKGREVKASDKKAEGSDEKLVVHVARRENCPPVWD